MRSRLAALNLAQRVVAVVALAAGLRAAFVYFVSLSDRGGGWFGYAPNTGGTYAPLSGDTYPARTGTELFPALLAIVLIAIWAFASIWLLGLSVRGSRESPQTPESN